MSTRSSPTDGPDSVVATIIELIESVHWREGPIYPDRLEVAVHGVPRLDALHSEVGFAQAQKAGVGGGLVPHLTRQR